MRAEKGHLNGSFYGHPTLRHGVRHTRRTPHPPEKPREAHDVDQITCLCLNTLSKFCCVCACSAKGRAWKLRHAARSAVHARGSKMASQNAFLQDQYVTTVQCTKRMCAHRTGPCPLLSSMHAVTRLHCRTHGQFIREGYATTRTLRGHLCGSGHFCNRCDNAVGP